MDSSISNAFILGAETEADTCRKEVTPKLKASGWDDERILEQRAFTKGKVVVVGRNAKRQKVKRADYLLRYSQDYLLAVVEAKRRYKSAGAGLQQAKDYAEILKLKFAYATNGHEIIEYDFLTGQEARVDRFPTPDELWLRLHGGNLPDDRTQELLLKPLRVIPGKEIRYYQQLAVNRATRAILDGQQRLLLTLATGTGKTTVAFQLIYKLWENRWNRTGEHRRPKVLFLADRSVLVDEPHAKDFALFGDARCLLSEDGPTTSREIYFALYQGLAEDDNRDGLFRKFPRDFFDLIVIDECHRGSASEDSSWRRILDYFAPAVKLGLTATPLREDNKDTYQYFGDPLYTYSLRQGIEDGFLAPYIVHRVVTDVDARGWRPQAGQTDREGALIPDREYHTEDFEQTVAYLPRTKAVAQHLTEFLRKNGRFDKTIVFCHDQPHADEFRREFNNLNTDLTRQHPNYCVRITSDEGDVGKGFLSDFMDIEKEIPVVVTTSKLLSTGVDIPTCRNVVIFRLVNSMTEFKQIVGRGTRIREDKQKLFFTILDYTGSATSKFADPEFDGVPPLLTQEEIDEQGRQIAGSFEEFPDPDQGEDEDDDDQDNGNGGGGGGGGRRKFHVDEGQAAVVNEAVHMLDSQGQLRTVQFTQYAKEEITTMFTSAGELRAAWSDLHQREHILQLLEAKGIELDQLADFVGKPEADPFDVLCYVAFDLKPRTRRERAAWVRQHKAEFFSRHSAQAREILEQILKKYEEIGPSQVSPEIVSVPPLTQYGNAAEIAAHFGGVGKLVQAVDEMQQILYAEDAA
ncbi:DEAD/DEAH box helicase [Hymenobacter lutimineralis]|uniref:DEAD/DEAH box helicase n=1 Tax=Hymenobacter lutimineralis TaxID=2606448 RepID=A0A5D6VBT6_9BACT|nr:DEAD/DEAH box helicase family protein [Hymenobacter lutimineralis]TYZ12715.1 DEAD/DEAH box helicase [Hymenobacter lutimineralis]